MSRTSSGNGAASTAPARSACARTGSRSNTTTRWRRPARQAALAADGALSITARGDADRRVAKDANNSDEVFWLAPDTVPTLGDWFRAGGYRTFFKGKWHASHSHLDGEDSKDYLLSIDDDGKPQQENIEKYLEADLLDEYGFSEWVGPEPHGLGKHNMGTVKDPFTADETIALLERLAADESDEPWLTVCSFLNPHDDSLFGLA